jgi:hypothetical protein
MRHYHSIKQSNENTETSLFCKIEAISPISVVPQADRRRTNTSLFLGCVAVCQGNVGTSGRAGSWRLDGELVPSRREKLDQEFPVLWVLATDVLPAVSWFPR